MISDMAIDDLLAAAVRGETAPWPSAWQGDDDEEIVLRRIVFHGIEGLLSRVPELLAGWPESMKARLLDQARLLVMWEMAHHDVIASLLAEFHAAGVEALVMKGTALAYSLYEEPALRPRGDSDLLVRASDLPAARRVLAAQGFTRNADFEGPFGSTEYQEPWTRDFHGRSWHPVDLHWQVVNARALGKILEVEECFASALPLPSLGPQAKAMGGVNRLIHGCINRKAHETGGVFVLDRNVFSGDRLCWAVDFDLQIAKFTQGDWREFTDKAIEMGVTLICLDGLKFAQRTLHTRIPTKVLAQLAETPDDGRAVAYLENDRNLTRALLDFKASDGLHGKLRFILQKVFPSRDMLQIMYPHLENWPSGLLYLRRPIEVLRRLRTGKTD